MLRITFRFFALLIPFATPLAACAAPDDDIAKYTAVLERNPRDVSAYMNRGIAWHAKRDFDKAIQDYTAAIQLSPRAAAGYNNRGTAYSDKRDFDKAIEDFNVAVRLSPAEAAVYVNRGNALRAKGEYDKAIDDYDVALRISPKELTAYNNRGTAWRAKGENAKAIKDYDEVLRLNPNHMATRVNRGIVLRDTGQYEKAVTDFQTAIRLDPNDPRAYNGLAWLWAVCPDEKFRDGRRAVAFATKACELFKWKALDGIDTLAAAYAESGDFDEAVRWEKKVLEAALSASDKADCEKRLALYQDHKPYREAPKSAAPQAK